jgi:hypothetical protein
MMTVDDLRLFLTARYDEWERRARAAYPHETGSRDEGQPPDWVSYRRGPGNAEFGLRHVATLRAIVALHHVELIEGRNADGDERSEYFCAECDLQAYPCPTLRHLAADFSHLPDYRQEWKP